MRKSAAPVKIKSKMTTAAKTMFNGANIYLIKENDKYDESELGGILNALSTGSCKCAAEIIENSQVRW